jgi:hypothetical protein
MTDHPTTRDSLGDTPLQRAPHVYNTIEIVDNSVDTFLRNPSARGKTHWWTHYPHRTVENPEDRLEDSTANR